MDVADVWRQHRRWSIVTSRADRFLRRWRSVNFGLIVAGSALGALAAQDTWFSTTVTVALGIVGASALAVAAVLQSRVLSTEKLRERVAARATSETMKGLVFQYLAGVEPFAGADRDLALNAKVKEVRDRATARKSLTMGVEPDDKPLPSIIGIADYVRGRAEDQRNWHDRRSGDHRTLAGRWRAAEVIATAAAAVLAAAGGVLHGPDLSAWVAVATTVAAAIAAHLAVQQHERIADAYGQTVIDLDALLGDLDPAIADPARAAAFVADVERVLAAQNGAWVSLF